MVTTMTTKQFYELPVNDQLGLLVEDGKYIADKQDSELRVVLYKVHNLFIEVYYNKKYKAVNGYAAFSRFELIDKYLSKN
jgi:hypothetical protein